MIEFAAPSAHLRLLDVNSVYGLMNIGATAVVSAESKGVVDAMACAWNCALDLNPTKVTVVLSKSHFTRRLLEESGLFALSLGAVGNVAALQQLGSVSMNRDAEKLEKCPGRFFRMPGWEMPLLEGSPAYLVCRRIPEPHVEGAYDLFIGEVVAAWGDDRVVSPSGDWQFEKASAELRTIHAAAHGRFYAAGEVIEVR